MLKPMRVCFAPYQAPITMPTLHVLRLVSHRMMDKPSGQSGQNKKVSKGGSPDSCKCPLLNRTNSDKFGQIRTNSDKFGHDKDMALPKTVQSVSNKWN
jgi:hypothetical protein